MYVSCTCKASRITALKPNSLSKKKSESWLPVNNSAYTNIDGFSRRISVKHF